MAAKQEEFLDLTFVSASPQKSIAVDEQRDGALAIKRRKGCSIVCLNTGASGYEQAIARSTNPARVVVGQPARCVDQTGFFGLRIKANDAAKGSEPQAAVSIFKNVSCIITCQRFQ